jgi:hypothetical protein
MKEVIAKIYLDDNFKSKECYGCRFSYGENYSQHFRKTLFKCRLRSNEYINVFDDTDYCPIEQ